MSFESLGLSAELLRAVSEQGYTEPTPIQRQAIPAVLEGRDLMAGAQTGTGKTAGFTLPLLQLLSTRPAERRPRAVRALVLAPTRELAAQVADSVETYGRHLPHRAAVIFGGVNINPQIDRLRAGVEILIATPGRLLDHVQRKTVDLSQVEILVLDEADRMLDMGFIHDIRRIIKCLPDKHERQSLLFSATFSNEIQQLARQLLDHPELIEVARRNATVELIEQVAHPVDKHRKREVLSHLVGAGFWQQVLVFTRTKHGANRLARQLEADGLSAAAIHGNKSQAARTRALADFKQGRIRVLVATDIAARGLDIDQLPHVVNFELPNVPEDYVHRIGRTGRAGNAGTALSLVSADENGLLRDIEKLLGQPVPMRVLEGYEPGQAANEPQEPNRDKYREGRGRNGAGRGGRSASGNGAGRGNAEGRGNGRGRGNSEGRGNGQGRGNSEGRGNAQGRGNSEGRGNGRGRGNAEGRGNSEGRGQAQGRGNSEARGNSESRGNGRGRDNAEGRGHSEGRGNGRGRDNAEGRGHSEGRGNGRGHGNAQGRGNGQGRGEYQGRGHSQGRGEGQWRGEGRAAGSRQADRPVKRVPEQPAVTAPPRRERPAQRAETPPGYTNLADRYFSD